MSERITTVLEIECECGEVWEADCYADFDHHDLVPEFVNVSEAECDGCWKYLTPRRGVGIGDAILKRFAAVEGRG